MMGRVGGALLRVGGALVVLGTTVPAHGANDLAELTALLQRLGETLNAPAGRSSAKSAKQLRQARATASTIVGGCLGVCQESDRATIRTLLGSGGQQRLLQFVEGATTAIGSGRPALAVDPHDSSLLVGPPKGTHLKIGAPAAEANHPKEPAARAGKADESPALGFVRVVTHGRNSITSRALHLGHDEQQRMRLLLPSPTRLLKNVRLGGLQ